MMQGLELSRRYFEACLPLLQEQAGDILPLCAVGLAGEGSECLGFDDATSRDHDWGPGFCIWLSREDLARHRQRLEDVLRLLHRPGHAAFRLASLAGHAGMGTGHLYQWRSLFRRARPFQCLAHDPAGLFSP